MATLNMNTEAFFRNLEAHRYELALRSYDRIADPSPYMLWWRSICHLAQEEFEEALRDSIVLLDIDETHNRGCLNMALIRAASPVDHLRDGKDASYFMTRFVALHEGEMTWRIFSIRAAVYAEQGDFINAIKYSRMSLDCAPSTMVARCESRLSQYEQRIAFRASAQSIREGLFFRELACKNCGEPAFFTARYNDEAVALCCDCNWGKPKNA